MSVEQLLFNVPVGLKVGSQCFSIVLLPMLAPRISDIVFPSNLHRIRAEERLCRFLRAWMYCSVGLAVWRC